MVDPNGAIKGGRVRAFLKLVMMAVGFGGLIFLGLVTLPSVAHVVGALVPVVAGSAPTFIETMGVAVGGGR